ncbi:MAG: ATP-binding protein [Acidobacteria bacterium]|nr:ATP-binding protein [Acidobacteriota bacterium]
MTEAAPAKAKSFAPPVPESITETGLSFQFLADLALKTAGTESSLTTAIIAERMCLPLSLVEDLMQHLYREKMVEIRGNAGFNNNRYALLDRGWETLRRVQEISGYVGPAPVSLTAYTAMMRSQAQPDELVGPDQVATAFSDLVLPDSLLQTLGFAINSRRSLFISGIPGTGKTSVAERINNALQTPIWIPYSVAVDEHVINVYDGHNHERTLDESEYDVYDRRWIRIMRPLIIVGGEMTLESTDLIYNRAARYYEAPFQIKANCGTLVVDDFGRQRVEPEELLNRWIVPLERKVDFLTLHTGKKISVPFEQLVVFSTNLEPSRLVDEAFLRRMGYRVRIEPPAEDTYRRIFERRAEMVGVSYDSSVLDYLISKYPKERRVMKSCEPRDLLNRFLDICQYKGLAPTLNVELLDLAWDNYFGIAHV